MANKVAQGEKNTVSHGSPLPPQLQFGDRTFVKLGAVAVLVLLVLVFFMSWGSGADDPPPSGRWQPKRTGVDCSSSCDGKERFVIITIATDERVPYRCQSIHNKRMYAQRHGYDFVALTRTLEPSRPAHWSKLLAVQQILYPLGQQALSRYDWAWLVDLDTVIMTPRLKLEDIIVEARKLASNPETMDIVISKDCNSYNSGSFFLRRSPFVQRFLQQVWHLNNASEVRNLVKWKEQASIIHALEKVSNATENRKHAQLVPQKLLNAYAKEVRCGYVWHEGDLLLHVPGRAASTKANLMKQWGDLAEYWNPPGPGGPTSC
ncbi:alpha-1,6-mannosyltransferase [Balamuthia mandrillaris]